MPFIANKNSQGSGRIVQVALSNARVTEGFRESLFDAAGRAGQTVSEFALEAAGEKLRAAGRDFPGVFSNNEPKRDGS